MIELRRFFTKECLNKREWWNCIINICLQYIKNKKKELSIGLREKTLYSQNMALKIKWVVLIKNNKNKEN